MSRTDHTYRDRDLPQDVIDSLEGLPPSEADALIDAWKAAGTARPSVPSVGRDRVRSRVMAAVEPQKDRAPAHRTPALRLVRTSRFVSVAASVVLLVVASFLLSPDVTSYRAPAGTLNGLTVELSDGTDVTLAPGSRMYVTDTFGEVDRRVNLHGNAFFDVETTGTPFIVRTFDARTAVLGTSFDVQAWPTAMDAETSVHVLSGSVRVSDPASGAAVTLSPGESASTRTGTDDPVSLIPADVQRATAWRTGGFSFVNEPVGDVISEINRRFDIRIDAPASIRLRRISYWKQAVESPDEIMGDIAATIGVRYRRTANGFSLYLTD